VCCKIQMRAIHCIGGQFSWACVIGNWRVTLPSPSSLPSTWIEWNNQKVNYTFGWLVFKVHQYW
jgi:hypothetical protein